MGKDYPYPLVPFDDLVAGSSAIASVTAGCACESLAVNDIRVNRTRREFMGYFFGCRPTVDILPTCDRGME